MVKIFSGDEDLDRNILLNIDDDKVLFNTCKLNKYTKVLYGNHFWESKINQLLPGFEFPLEYQNKGEKLYLIIKREGDDITNWAI